MLVRVIYAYCIQSVFVICSTAHFKLYTLTGRLLFPCAHVFLHKKLSNCCLMPNEQVTFDETTMMYALY